MGAACHSPHPSRSQIHYNKARVITYLLWQVYSHPSTQLIEFDIQEFPVPPEQSTTVHPRILHLNLSSYILFAVLSSFICSTCPNHLKAHLSALPDISTYTPTLLLISSFLVLSLTVTPHILCKHLISITFNLLFSLTFKPHISAPYSIFLVLLKYFCGCLPYDLSMCHILPHNHYIFGVILC